jgi:hypothetical protein
LRKPPAVQPAAFFTFQLQRSLSVNNSKTSLIDGSVTSLRDTKAFRQRANDVKLRWRATQRKSERNDQLNNPRF